MKKYFDLLPLIIILVSACTSVVDIYKDVSGTKQSPQFYKDKIALLNFEYSELTDSDSSKIKIANKISEVSNQDFDAVILSINSFSDKILNSSLEKSKFINKIQNVIDLVSKNGLKILLEINFNALNRTFLSPTKMVAIKINFHILVKNCEIDGFYFKEIDYSSKDDNNLLEDIVVESMLLKPFLIVSIPANVNETNYSIVEKYLEKGILDFIINDNNNYSVQYNKYINAAEEKILKNYLKRLSPDHFISFNLSEVIDKNIAELEILNERRTKVIDADMKVNFILTEKFASVNLKIGNSIHNISSSDWVIPFNYLLNKDNTVSRYNTWVEFRRPFAKITSNDIYNLLCRTKYPSKVFINDDSLKIYKTGVFFKKIKLKEGLNKLRAVVKADNGETAIYEDRVLFQKKDPAIIDGALSITENSIDPAENITLMPEDQLKISFNGTKSQKGFIEIIPGDDSFECQRNDFKDFSHYEVQLPLKNFIKNKKLRIKLILEPSGNNADRNPVEKLLDYYLLIKDYNDFPLLTTTNENSILTFTLAPIRLGAPLRNELPKNVILKSNGVFGEYYRIRLSDTEEGYINREYVKELPASSKIPNYFINPITGYPTENSDIIKIPYLENVPYDIYPDPAQKRIIINLYGVKTSSTWIIHRKNLRYVDEITWQQSSKETYKIYINLKTSKIWGYDIKPNGKELVFRIKYPPIYNLETNLPLTGIKFSLEAGHGGSNLGAVGLSGMKEKEINLKLCKILEILLKKNGAEVLQVRDSDKDMTLIEKRDIVTNSDANIHLSIHANASDPENEFLGASGTCTFYHNPFWARLAEKVYSKLIELDLKPFGSVGSFNYRVTRMSDIPAILVEQAFMSNAEDEEKLYSDDFRMQMAEKIYNGIIDYLKYMKD